MTSLESIRSLLPDEANELAEDETRDALRKRIMILNERVWERRVSWDLVERWLGNFDGKIYGSDRERLHSLYWLSQFLYFGNLEIRVLLRALYRDLFLIPLIQEVRTANGGTRDSDRIRKGLEHALDRTRFLGVGNPSESGVHLLYFFRQENGLKKGNFMDAAQLLETVSDAAGSSRQLRHPDLDRYVFVDDICGTGETAVRYSNDFLTEMRRLRPELKIAYFSLFATTKGLKRVREETVFKDDCGAVFEFDESYRCLSADSRYMKVVPAGIEPDVLRETARKYGELVCPPHPTGYQDSQLLFGFHHNTPDNTLPIVWMDPPNGSQIPWTPVFRRYPKV